MENRNKKEQPVEVLLIFGILICVIFHIMNDFVVEIPKILAYPWLIGACICMLLGIVRVRKEIEKQN